MTRRFPCFISPLSLTRSTEMKEEAGRTRFLKPMPAPIDRLLPIRVELALRYRIFRKTFCARRLTETLCFLDVVKGL